jgi:capsular polysaccharide biosynthesis protein
MLAVTETMGYEEDVRLFANARIIVGAGGSGLSNVIFCRGRIKMVEISGHEGRCKYPDSTSYSLTAGLGHEFSVYLAKALKRLAPARFDLVVDVPDFCKFLQRETD